MINNNHRRHSLQADKIFKFKSSFDELNSKSKISWSWVCLIRRSSNCINQMTSDQITAGENDAGAFAPPSNHQIASIQTVLLPIGCCLGITPMIFMQVSAFILFPHFLCFFHSSLVYIFCIYLLCVIYASFMHHCHHAMLYTLHYRNIFFFTNNHIFSVNYSFVDELVCSSNSICRYLFGNVTTSTRLCHCFTSSIGAVK